MTQFDDEAFAIIEQYQQLLMLKSPIPSSILVSINTNVIYFVLKEMLNTIIGTAQLVDNFSENLKLGRIVAENFDKKLKSEAEKRQQICLLHSFLAWLIRKNNLFTESGEVKEFLIVSGLLESDLTTIQSAKSDAWNKPNCENEKSFDFPTSENFATFSFAERNFYYENIFWADNINEQMFIEIILALRHAIHAIYENVDKKSKRKTNAVAGTIPLLYDGHQFKFLTKSNKNDMLVKVIRETLGKLNVLEQFISVDELHKHFHNASIREKMIDRKLCGHTDLERLSNRVSADLIVLMIDYFDTDKLGQEEMTLRSFMDWWWLYFRVMYESIIEHPEDAQKGSYVINILIQEIDKFLGNNKKLVAKKLNVWTAIEKAVAETELQWVESQNVPADPIEMIQKMHFNQLNLLKNDPEVWHQNVELYKEIELNKNFPEVVYEKAKSTTNDIFSEFCDDSILMTKYRKYVLNDFDAKSMDMLALGAYLNEIEHRVKLISDIERTDRIKIGRKNRI
uniref:Uncharacterized protein n=1 Tax=Globodera rostochiensis TaxID=31243 RepID=A0A914I011_GLORO